MILEATVGFCSECRKPTRLPGDVSRARSFDDVVDPGIVATGV
jgi:hypothetical protein